MNLEILAEQPLIRIVAPSRLHFGLMEICAGQPHCYGGMGVMIDTPSLVIEATLSTQWATDQSDPWHMRIEYAAQHWMNASRLECLPPLRLRVTGAPLPHCGLGTGTQLACSVIAILESWRTKDSRRLELFDTEVKHILGDADESELGSDRLALQSGRGHRSFVGLNGFLHGGWIFDSGLNPTSSQRQLESQHKGVDRVDTYAQHDNALGSSNLPSSQRQPESQQTGFDRPDTYTLRNDSVDSSNNVFKRQVRIIPSDPEWCVVLATPRGAIGASGSIEVDFFQQCSSAPNPNRQRMLNLISETILPGLAAIDLSAIAPAINEYGMLAGEVFSKVQQGSFRSQMVSDTVNLLKRCGAVAVGQSSWGPTVFAVMSSRTEAEQLVKLVLNTSTLQLASLQIARLARCGATVTCSNTI